MSERPTFTYFGHATVMFEMPSGESILIDPWVDNNPACPEELKELDRVDGILITHGHGDHVGDAIEICRKHRPAKIACSHEIAVWLGQNGVKNASGMNLGGSQDVLGAWVTQVRADHSSGLLDADGRLLDGGEPSGFVVRMPDGFTFYHAGDTALFSDMQLIAEMHAPELGFLPIGDLYTMGPAAAARACRFLGLRQVVPIHYGTFPSLTGTPEQLRIELATFGVDCEVLEMAPGDRL